MLVSPHRTQRPWQGAEESTVATVRPQHDPSCYLCPGNPRAGGAINPDYKQTFVFTNDYSALLPREGSEEEALAHDLIRAEGAAGECRVICYSPRHDVSLADMDPASVVPVIDVWADQVADLGERYRWVQIFENKGSAMGASNPHPHGQVWASDFLPTIAQRESETQSSYELSHGRPMLVALAEHEIEEGTRVVAMNDDWVLLIPFWAIWPFEYLLLPRRHVLRLPDLDGQQRLSLADILSDALRRYDALFDTSFPYSMGWHGAPTDGLDHPGWQLHAHFYPPLLRSANVRKFMVGFEMLAEAQRDITPEAAAERLRNL